MTQGKRLDERLDEMNDEEVEDLLDALVRAGDLEVVDVANGEKRYRLTEQGNRRVEQLPHRGGR